MTASLYVDSSDSPAGRGSKSDKVLMLHYAFGNKKNAVKKQFLYLLVFQ